MTVHLDHLEELARAATPTMCSFVPSDCGTFQCCRACGTTAASYLGFPCNQRDIIKFQVAANPAAILELIKLARGPNADS